MKVLVVDDDSIHRKFLETIFSYSWEVCVAQDGISAVDLFEEHLKNSDPFQLICLDVMLNQLDGYKTLQAIRKVEKSYSEKGLQRTKVIMMSALDEDTRNDICVCSDYDAYMCKPILIEALELQLKKLGF